MHWSCVPEEIAKEVLAHHPASFWVRPRRVPVPPRRTYFLLQPLDDVSELGHDHGPMPGGEPGDWLVWQSETSTGCATKLPTDGGLLAGRLGFGGPSPSLVRLALQELMAAIYATGETR